MQRIVLLAVAGAIVAAMAAIGALSVSAQSTEQDALCAPWSQEWDISQGWWYFQWYRWCYDPTYYDPAYESSWYTENGSWEWGEKANLCPGKGTCSMSPEGGMVMTSGTP